MPTNKYSSERILCTKLIEVLVMFICTLRSTGIKLGVWMFVSFSVLLLLLWFLPSGDAVDVSSDTDITYSDVSDEASRISFIKSLGWNVVEGSCESKKVTIPSNFDKIYTQYNEIQKKQGLDLSKYKRKTVMKYTYEVENFEKWQGKVFVTLLIYNDCIVGGDISSALENGFVCGFDGNF